MKTEALQRIRVEPERKANWERAYQRRRKKMGLGEDYQFIDWVRDALDKVANARKA